MSQPIRQLSEEITQADKARWDATDNSANVHSPPSPPRRVGSSRRRPNAQEDCGRRKRSVNAIRQDLCQSLDRSVSVVERRTPAAPVADVHSPPSPPRRVGSSRRRPNAQEDRGRRKRSVNAIREDLCQSLDRLVSVVERRTPAAPVADVHSIREVCRQLEAIPETSSGGPLTMFALKLFEKKENREMFAGIGRQDWQLLWIQMKYDEENGGGSSSMG
ncbi:hypothetical protein HS088_TW02G00192 [Tripterygium wilfordii]|uniref:Uncharacterized protein n=1 Tax=Tripterygium wilfordii TaxID=458696 RepID=A0A7J7DXT1_TRIWF|nr:uncharacterized protein LOC120007829 [Tripterygium wilfordii]KAF5751182.1 hypothetical protein HS088_TW02G00192 [Tripterygium wilfordii]